MSGRRLAQGGLIERDRRLRFSFDGRHYSGHPGDTLASALLAAGARIFARSFKYHRPRGIWGAWVDDGNALMNVRLHGLALPNLPAATTPLQEGMQLRAVNAWPSAARDVKGVLDVAHRLMPAGFYYKTFMWPSWHVYEPMIRAMAGLGALEQSAPYPAAPQRHASCELLVIGAGGAGLAAARVAAEAGQEVWLVDDHAAAGGALYGRTSQVEGKETGAWIADELAAFRQAGGRFLPATTAFGVYDHGLVALAQARGFGQPPQLTRLRARRVLLASGALDRPLVFPDNDRPGVMALSGALEFLGRYGVLVGERIALIGKDREAADRLRAAGGEVVELDAQGGPIRAIGARGLRGLRQGGRRIACDIALASAGQAPLVHLWRHGGGGLEWDEAIGAFVPGRAPQGWAAIGAANGLFGLDQALEQARATARGSPSSPRRAPRAHVWPHPGSAGRQWVDFQHDVTAGDIALAAREGYGTVEHLKRYTTLGMAQDQGKTANINALSLLAADQGKSIAEAGTTTFRPPFVPQPLALYGGLQRGALFHPLKRLGLEQRHRGEGAVMDEYGGWLRPAWYGDKGEKDAAIAREALAARGACALFDASPLGKIEVMGADAAKFLNFIYYNDISTLRPGQIRYGLMLREDGTIFDDGVITCLAPDHYLISCSSSHLGAVLRHLEAWRQDGHDSERIFIHDSSDNWATLALSGPGAQALGAGLGLDLAGLGHMSARAGSYAGAPVRIARVSFTGEASYEVSLPPPLADAFWSRARALGAVALGLEALMVLRAEKGYVIIGKDTDGTTMAHDLGFGAPMRNKKTAFIGDRALRLPVAQDPRRRQLVGLEASGARLPVGAHLVEGDNCSIGIVTSSYQSPTLRRPIALALLAGGRARIGTQVSAWHMGEIWPAKVVAPCFYDAKGARLDG